MAKKSLFVGILAMALVFGMIVVSCDNGSGGGGEYTPPELPESVGENPLGGKTYEDSYLKVVFDNDGTYALSEDDDGSGAEKSMELSNNGDYSWNTTAKTVTLAPKEVASPNGGMIDFAETKALLQEHPEYLTDSHGVTSTVNELLAEIFGLKKYEYELNEQNISSLEIFDPITYSIQVKNQAAGQSNQQLSVARSLSSEDTVELHILNFEYCEDANNRALILVANGDRDTGSKHTILNNAGWFSTDADLEVKNDVNDGPYSSFQVKITKLKVNNTTYDFPTREGGVFFGHPTSIWNGGQSNYPNNFSGITIPVSPVSLKTVLTVEPGIIGEANSDGYDSSGLATDPYRYIKVEGRVNE